MNMYLRQLLINITNKFVLKRFQVWQMYEPWRVKHYDEKQQKEYKQQIEQLAQLKYKETIFD